jgi:hypothetical protein
MIPPVRASVVVPLDQARAFELFTSGIGEWWPYRTHFSRGPVESLIFEARVGGELKEVCTDGVVVTYARVLVWEPPARVVISWFVQPSLGEPSEVEVTFSPTEGGTRVDLEHRGFEAYGEVTGNEQRNSYSRGWPGVMALFAARASKAPGRLT